MPITLNFSKDEKGKVGSGAVDIKDFNVTIKIDKETEEEKKLSKKE